MRVPVPVNPERDDRGTSSTSGSSDGESTATTTTSGSSDPARQLQTDTVVRDQNEYNSTITVQHSNQDPICVETVLKLQIYLLEV